MRIVFNLQRVGLGNNGGSRTVIKSAETLASLGQEVIISSNIKNKYTWEKINSKVKFICGKNIPKGDVIIATGIGSVPSTISSKFKKKFYYIRGFETWAAKESTLFKSYSSLRCIVNSSWLKQLLNGRGIKCDVIYNGLDFNDFYNLREKRNIPLGGLYSKRHKTKNHAFISKCAGTGGIRTEFLNKDIKDPDPNCLNRWYNAIKVWAAASELEGLHNPPMEASLSGCGLVATNHPRSGTSDYVIHNETALLYEHGNMGDFNKKVSQLLEDEHLRCRLNGNMVALLRNKIGTRQENMKKFLEII